MLPIRWSLLSEFFSLLLLIIICTHYFGYERNTAFTGRRKLFLCCLLSAMGSIILNIITLPSFEKLNGKRLP